MSANNVTLTVSFLNGEQCSINTPLDATLGDVKAKISKETGHSPWNQRLSLGATPLADSSTPLKNLGVTGASPLSLVVVQEPIGQSSLVAPDGKKEDIITEGKPFPQEMLTEFQFMSWQAVCAAHESHSDELEREWDEDFREQWGVDLYWTTRSDGCRYEYWSSAPENHEFGVLVRVDNQGMAAIGMGSDHGLEIFEECGTSDVIKKLICEGWPCWKDTDSSDKEMEIDNEE